MVFSQTSLNTRNVLKVVEIDHLRSEKNQFLSNGSGANIGGYQNATQFSPIATTSLSEEFLKPEPAFETSTMYQAMDYEFFQDLVPLSSTPAKEGVAQTIDSTKKTKEGALKIDTPHTPFSPQRWESFDVNSPFSHAGFYNTFDQLSPNTEKLVQYENSVLNLPQVDQDNNNQFHEKFVDICSLPVVIGDLTSDKVTDMNPWPVPDQVEWTNTQDTQYSHMYTNTPTTAPFIDAEDSLDLKFVSVIPREVESNNVVISEYIINEDQNFGMMQEPTVPVRNESLSVDVSARAPAWPDDLISTPEILSCVEQLEKESSPQYLEPLNPTLWSEPTVSTPSPGQSFMDTFTDVKTPSPLDYEPITPKSETHLESDNDESKSTTSKKRRRGSEDSDETYTPYVEQPTRKYRRRKPSVPIKEMILALEGQPKARRGRPPKRRESTVSSVCSVDENSSSISTQETKYRELRDKNNEASKRSRMNRKLKELQMEQLALELEEKNKKLRVKADILEEMTKRLKNELMSAILKKK